MRTHLPVTLLIMLSSLGLSSGGCATMTRGESQKMKFVTEPAGATVTADGKTYTTPVEISVKRKNAHTIEISKPGFQTIQFNLRSHWDAGGFWAVVTDIAVPGGSAMFVIDQASGAGSKFNELAIIKLPPAGPTTRPLVLFDYQGKLLTKAEFDTALLVEKKGKAATQPASPQATAGHETVYHEWR